MNNKSLKPKGFKLFVLNEQLNTTKIFTLKPHWEINMFYRLSASHIILALITIATILGIVGIMLQQFDFLALHFNSNLIPEETSLEMDISILLASFGVFLEHRNYLLDKIYPQGPPSPVKIFDDYSHNVGVILLLMAILMEILDLLFNALNNFGLELAGQQYIEISVLFFLNFITLTMLLVYLFRLASNKK